MNKKTILVSMLLFVQGTFLSMAQNVARKELLTAVVRQNLSIVEVQKINRYCILIMSPLMNP